ncbi:BON domain-containing protein [Desulfomicrobium sp. ZS1]|uniref:BON domain-containing protein n=1 Tax=Desulfomicrobium sp. ZS1 TaxID=2952228 RepID=UPI0020B2FFA5|nr:BON domain-containing protein [Desulfomicrobium sp. ZS1]UTF50738.1 BON domain-containing protein [Desulfomicrobium sp. ZS1]
MSLADTGDDSVENYMNIFKIILCTLLLASLMSCAGTDTKQSTGQYVDDSAITAKVKAAIFDEDSLKSRQINVETFKGVVQLSGFVDSPRNSSKAEQIARDVDGVKSVINNIVVK